MANYNISFDASSLIAGLNLQLETAIKRAVQTTALTAYTAWKETINQSTGLRQPIKDRYAASINIRFDPDGMGARIYSDDPMATPIETGIPARDMKRALDTSAKVRVAKNGKHPGQRYLIIPFRHNTPGNVAHAKAMPMAVYEQAKELTKSHVTGKVSARSGLNASSLRTKGPLMTMRNTYKWGGRLDGDDIPKNLRGMVRFNTSSGGQKNSSFLTFRAMGEWSSGWIIPAQPGRYIVKDVSAAAQSMLREEVTAAIASVS